jgi:thioredoxin-related protein
LVKIFFVLQQHRYMMAALVIELLSPASQQKKAYMRDLSKKLEIGAHIAIIVVAILVSVVLVKNYLLPHRDQPDTRSDTRPQVSAGTRLSVPDIDWAKNGRTLMVVLSTNCRFCTASAPLYQQIAQETSQRQDIKVIALFPQPVADAEKYLSSLGVAISEVKQITPDVVGVRGTPTLLLVDNTGTVQKVWIGKLPPDKESEVLKELRRVG